MRKQLAALALREVRAVRVPVVATLALASAIAFALAWTTPPTLRFELLASERARLAMHGVAFALGLVLAWFQVEDERQRDTWTGFLMLPLGRTTLVATKAAVGVVAVALAAGLPALGLAVAVAAPSGTGGPVDPATFAAPLTVTFAGSSAYFAGWIAALAPRSGRLSWIRFFALGTGALGALLAGASLLGGAPSIAFAALPALGLGGGALRLAARPTGGSAPFDRVMLALAIAPVFAVGLAGVATIARIGEPQPPGFTAYHSLDVHGDVVRIDRDTSGIETVSRLGGGAPVAIGSYEARRSTLLSLSPLDRRALGAGWSRVSFPTGSLFYRGATRELAYYRASDGERVGCLGPSGFALPCAPLEGELIDVLQDGSFDGGVFVITTTSVLRLAAPSAAPVELVRGDVRAAHTLAATGVLVEVDGEARLIGKDGPSARCALPEGAAPRTPERPWSVVAAPTVDGSIAMLVDHADGSRSARRCDREGAVVADTPVPVDRSPTFGSRDGVARAAAGPLLNVAASLVRPEVDRLRPDPWIPAAVAATAAAVLAAASRRRTLGAVLAAALFGFAVGPAYLLAYVVARVAGRARRARPAPIAAIAA